MAGDTEDVIEATGCTHEDAVIIEFIMREEIFHSTLDWQSAADFRRAAHKAARILNADREVYEEYFGLAREAYNRLRAENAARQKAVTYEI